MSSVTSQLNSAAAVSCLTGELSIEKLTFRSFAALDWAAFSDCYWWLPNNLYFFSIEFFLQKNYKKYFLFLFLCNV